jgi:enoyl-CoA hydratase/carnithine racemase
MRRAVWNHEESALEQISALGAEASEIGYLVVEFPGGGEGDAPPWSALEPWTGSRAVTVAKVAGMLATPALDVALCSDLVYLRPQTVLHLASSTAPPSAGVIWALGRAGRAALARGLPDPAGVSASDAVSLGLASGVVESEGGLQLPSGISIASLTAARDLMRSRARGSAGLALELASFRLLFAAGDPEEGARAFLEKRNPNF